MAIKIPIEFEGKSNSSVAKAFEDTAKQAENLSQKLTATAVSYLALDSIFEKGKELFKVLAEYALEYEKAANKLKITLDIMGISVDKNFESIKNFAESMQSLSGVQDELVMNVTSTNIALGLNVKQAEAMTQAALGLSKAQGVDLATANSTLIQSLNGQVRGLRDVGKEFSSLNKVALSQGAAIDIVGQKFNKFITADMSTTGGALLRVKVAFEDIIKTIGIAFFEGLNIPGHLDEIKALMDEFTDAVHNNRQAFVDFGSAIASTFVPTIKVLSTVFGVLVDLITTMKNALVTTVTVALYPFEQAANRLVKIFSVLKGLKFDAVTTGGVTTPKLSYTGADKTLGKVADDDFAKNNAKLAAQLSGNPFDTSTAQATNKKAESESFGSSYKGIGQLQLPENEQLKTERLGFTKTIEAQILELKLRSMNETEAAYMTSEKKIDEFAASTKLKGFNFTKQINQAQVLLLDDYVDKQRLASIQQRSDAARLSGDQYQILDTQYALEVSQLDEKLKKKDILNFEYYAALNELDRKHSQDEQTLNNSDALWIAEKSGDTLGVIKTQYDQELVLLQEKLDKGEIMQSQYDKAAAEAGRKSDVASSQTTGSASTDTMIGEATGVVNSIQGGLSSIISTIGTLTGPIGSLVASIVNLLNMSGAQFKALIDGIIQAIIDLPQHILGNIEYILTKIPEIIVSGYRTLFSVNFWTEAVSGLWQALKDMFHNFWAMLFGGDLINSAAQATQAPAFKGFGSSDPNAGNSEFKIKDLSQQSKADSFADTFDSTVKTAGKSFTDYMKDAWDQILKQLDKWFTGLPATIWNGLVALADGLKSWGVKIWQGFVDSALMAWLETLGTNIWNGLVGAGNKALIWLGSIGTAIWTGLSTALGAASTIFSNIGTSIWNGLKTALGAVGTIFIDLGTGIWNGLKIGLNTLTKFFTDMFSALNPSSLFEKMFKIPSAIGGVSYSGKGTVEKALGIDVPFLNFAQGGMVPGTALTPGDHIMNDRVIAYLSPGEAVIPRSLMADPAIAGMVGQLLTAPHHMGGFLGQVGGAISDTAKSVGGGISSVYHDIKDMSLSAAWDLVMPYVNKMMMSMFEANHLNKGGIVQGFSQGGIVPTASVTRSVSSSSSSSSSNSLQPSVYNFNFNVAAGSTFDKDAVKQAMPQIIDTLRRESRNGTWIVRQNGVRQ
jgi:hypothetical protein